MSGFDQLQRQLAAAQKALGALDGELTTVQFNPEDPESIEAAIEQVNQTINDRAGQYASNPLVGPLIDQMKEHYRQAILDKAEAARLGEMEEDAE